MYFELLGESVFYLASTHFTIFITKHPTISPESNTVLDDNVKNIFYDLNITIKNNESVLASNIGLWKWF